ncbi:MAG TPA: polysaccharide biosynthesis C-terminal domain-containing protein [Candidatus Sulfotelmatobacter sp.]|nr:polysaccharide biosynthesis C-terminal domain-containing protein [Candidatus Sulfotelmatobacter sp.]
MSAVPPTPARPTGVRAPAAPETDSRHYAQGIVTSVVLALVVAAKEVLFLPLLSKGLGPAEFGLWTMVRTVVQLFLPLALLGIENGMMRFWPALAQDRRAFPGTAAGILLAALGSATAVSGLALLAALGLLPRALRVLALAAALLAWGTVARQWFVTHFRATHAFAILTALVVAEAGGDLLAAGAALAAGGRVVGVVAALALVRGAMVLAALLAFGRTLGWAPPRLDHLGELVRFGAPTLPVALCLWLLNLSDRYLIAYFRGSEAVGVYAAAYGIGSVVILLFRPFFFNLNVVAAGRWDGGDRAGALRLVAAALRYGLLVAIPVSALLGVVSRNLVRLLASEAFVGGAGLICIIAFAHVLFHVSAFFEIILELLYRTKVLAAVYASAAGINVALNLVLLPRFGIAAAAVTTLLSFALMAALSQWFVAREVPVWPLWRELVPSLAKCLAATGAVVLAVRAWAPDGRGEALLAVAGGLAAYAGLLFALGGVSWAEVRALVASLHAAWGGKVAK